MKILRFSFIAFFSSFLFSCNQGVTDDYSDSLSKESAAFVGNNSCSECHTDAYNNWKNSDHDNAMAIASDSTVLGDFNDVKVNFRGVESRFYKKEEKFFVYTEGPEGKMGDFEVAYTFGVRPLQQYLIPFEKGRLQCLPIAWDTQQKKWFHLADSIYIGMSIPSHDWLYWTNNGQNWNAMCAECHSTNLEKNYDLNTQVYTTSWSEINVSCEACHGPASKHLIWSELKDEEKEKWDFSGFEHKSIDLNTEEMLNQCSYCHARRSSLSDLSSNGEHYLNQFLPNLVNEESYYFDGQILEEDYVFTSFTQSRMHTRNIKCSDCHEPHSLKTKQEGNLLCLQCHNFKIYDNESHHFHQKTGKGQSEFMTENGFYDQGDGTQCVDCHMTGKVYMGVDFRRDHNFRIPRPDVSMRVGSPDACTGCHKEMKQVEAVGILEKWYPGSFAKKQYGDLFHDIAYGDENAMYKILPYLNDTSKSSMVKASAIEYISRLYSIDGMEEIEAFLTNEDPLLRFAATQFYRNSDASINSNQMLKALNDPLRAIRTVAVINLLSMNYQASDSLSQIKFEKAQKEYLNYLERSADFAVSRHNLGIYYANKGETSIAIRHLKEAIKIDDRYYPAMLELAILYSRSGQADVAEKWLLYTLANDPDNLRAVSYMALLKAENKEFDQSISYFERAIEIDPFNPRFYYNLSFIYQEKNDFEKTEKNLLKAIELDPYNKDYLYGLAYFYKTHNNNEKALIIASKLIKLYPNDTDIKSFLLSFGK